MSALGWTLSSSLRMQERPTETEQAIYTADARNERADSRIIDGPASELIPPGRGRSLSTRE